MPGGARQIPGRGYRTDDLLFVVSSGIGSAIASMVVFLFFLTENKADQQVFIMPVWLWFSAIVISYWLLRVWLLTVRGEMPQDPILFALKDAQSKLLAAVVAVSLLLAWLGPSL